MYNIALYFESVQTNGSLAPSLPSGQFTIVSDNKESTSVQMIDSCSKQEKWNSWLCQNDDVAVMIFDNLDDDRMDRAMQPVYIRNNKGFDNRLNAYMDHCWDGFYTCQKRETRFPTIVETTTDYTIEFTGTPPAKQEFRLYGRSGTPGYVVTLQYNAAGAYVLYDQDRQPI